MDGIEQNISLLSCQVVYLFCTIDLLPLTMALCAALSGWVSPPMAHSQPKSPSWLGEREATGNSESPLPCLDSSKECVEQLTERAIAHSSKLKTLDDRIALIDRRLGLSANSIDYAESKLWTNYLFHFLGIFGN